MISNIRIFFLFSLITPRPENSRIEIPFPSLLNGREQKKKINQNSNKKKKKRRKRKSRWEGNGRHRVCKDTLDWNQRPCSIRPQCGPWFHRRRIVATPLHTGVPPRPVDSQPMSRIYLPRRSLSTDDRMGRERRPIRAAACNKRIADIYCLWWKKEFARGVVMNFDCIRRGEAIDRFKRCNIVKFFIGFEAVQERDFERIE